MPRKLKAGSSPVGNHPDAAPDNTIQRNTKAIGELVRAVNAHKESMAEMASELSRQMESMAEHREIIDAHFEETQRSANIVSELVLEMRALNLAIPTLVETINRHIPALDDNTKAIKKFRL